MTKSRTQLHRPAGPRRHVNKRKMMMAAAVVVLAVCLVVGIGFAMDWLGTDRSDYEVIFDGGTITGNITITVSYTHLDVYKRQVSRQRKASDPPKRYRAFGAHHDRRRSCLLYTSRCV